jgi:hypothetical protein
MVESGTMNLSGAGSYEGGKVTLLPEKPLVVKVAGLALRRSADAKSPVVVKDQSLDVNFAGVVDVSDTEVSADAAALSVVAPKLLEIRKNVGALTL